MTRCEESSLPELLPDREFGLRARRRARGRAACGAEAGKDTTGAARVVSRRAPGAAAVTDRERARTLPLVVAGPMQPDRGLMDFPQVRMGRYRNCRAMRQGVSDQCPRTISGRTSSIERGDMPSSCTAIPGLAAGADRHSRKALSRPSSSVGRSAGWSAWVGNRRHSRIHLRP
jgi:hypothetical protein